MNLKFFSSVLLFGGSALFAAAPLSSNIREIPGGIEVIDRENAATPNFSPDRKLKHQDHRVTIDFMDLSSGRRAEKLLSDPKNATQSGTAEFGKQLFSYRSETKKNGSDQVTFSFRIRRDTPVTLKETFLSLRLSASLQESPIQLELTDDTQKIRTHILSYPKAHQDGWLWSSPAGSRVCCIRIPLHHGELVIRGLSAPAMACKYGRSTGNLRLYLAKGKLTENGAELKISFEPYRAEVFDLKPAMNMGFADGIEADRKGGWTDQGPEQDLRMMKPGKRVFVNIPFEIVDPAGNKGKSVIVLGCPERDYFPRRAAVAGNGKICRWLYLLHAEAWPKNAEVGTVCVRYADNSSDSFKVIDKRDVANWYNPKSCSNAAIAWKAQSRHAFLGLFLSRFPLKGKPVKTIEFVSSGKSVWLILAASGVTAMQPPFPPADADAVEMPLVLDKRDWQPYSMTVARKHPVKHSALDFSFLLDAPAGKYGFLTGSGENFVFSQRPGVPVRFNGANLCGDVATRYTHAESEILAERMARLGINAVRLHHFDQDLVDDAKNDGSVDPVRLDSLHYLVHAMKKQGIYVTLDLYTRRTSGFPERYPGMFEVKSRMVFSKVLRDNLMNFARTLLTPVNPYTGLSLKDDPALIFIGLINEDPMMTTHNQYKYPNSDPVQHQLIKQAFEAWCAAQQLTAPARPDRKLYTRFLNEHHLAIYREMTAALRKMGVRQLTSDISCSANSINAIPRKEFGYVDNHFYFSHPHSLGKAWGFPSSVVPGSMTSTLFGNMTRVMASRIKGKPFTITEFNFCAPNEFRHEGGLAMGSLAAFQNVGGIFVFEYVSYGHRTRWNPLNRVGGHLGWFGIGNDPVRLLSQRVIALLYLRGDLQPAPEKEQLVLTVTPADYALEKVQNYPFFRLSKEAAIPEKFHHLAFYTKIATDAAATVPTGSFSLAEMLSPGELRLSRPGRGVYLPQQGKIISSTGEISIDAPSRTIKAVTPKSEGFTVTGKNACGKALAVSGSTGLCSVFAGSLDGKELTRSGRIVIFHVTDIQPSGRKKTVQGNTQIIYNWGKMDPYLMRKGKAEITLKNSGTGKLQLNALDINGAVLGPVPFREADGMVSFIADTAKYQSMVYELSRRSN